MFSLIKSILKTVSVHAALFVRRDSLIRIDAGTFLTFISALN